MTVIGSSGHHTITHKLSIVEKPVTNSDFRTEIKLLHFIILNFFTVIMDWFIAIFNDCGQTTIISLLFWIFSTSFFLKQLLQLKFLLQRWIFIIIILLIAVVDGTLTFFVWGWGWVFKWFSRSSRVFAETSQSIVHSNVVLRRIHLLILSLKLWHLLSLIVFFVRFDSDRAYMLLSESRIVNLMVMVVLNLVDALDQNFGSSSPRCIGWNIDKFWQTIIVFIDFPRGW